MKRLLVNDCLTTIPGTRTFWHDLKEWFGMEFCGKEFGILAKEAEERLEFFLQDGYAGDDRPELVIRNATFFPPIKTDVPTISLLQDIMPEGSDAAKTQEKVVNSSSATVFNSRYTAAKYGAASESPVIIPLPVDFDFFRPGNPMGLQQSLALPEGAVCWVGACQGAAAQVKGWDIFVQIVRMNPDIPFVAVFKDVLPAYSPPNLRMHCRVPHEELVKIYGACRVGLCTSRMETQHLAGIEMGACGLPMVAPPIGCYYENEELPGYLVADDKIDGYTSAIRSALDYTGSAEEIRGHWKERFDKPVVEAAWRKLIAEVESS